ncbi:hypothetical protein C8F04DRAFT_1189711 [Mycena alexandri]|uniref:Uncharacterized protein n=1 Tax=Mycena alexandri TaxID=1745969 RepID=A0AAD6WWH8_9AGAR|nr:hypothetical protein C8F04DRAFT_1189711 [Mycena alexandri]
MPASKFTPNQDAHMATYYPAFMEQAQNNPSDLKTWKKDTARTIAASPLFKGHLPDASAGGVPPDKWIKRIIKKLENTITKQKPVKSADGGNATGGQSSGTDRGHGNAKSMFQRPALTALALFRSRKADEIAAEAKRRARDSGAVNPLPFYQPARKALWEALSEDHWQEYEWQAVLLKNDVRLNQEAFKDDLWIDMDEFAKSKAVGPLCMTTLWSFQTPDGQTESGLACVTSLKGQPSFDTFCDQWGEFWSSWQRYSTACLPNKPVLRAVYRGTWVDKPVLCAVYRVLWDFWVDKPVLRAVYGVLGDFWVDKPVLRAVYGVLRDLMVDKS